MIKASVSLCLCLFFSIDAYPQKLYYDILIKNDTIGSLTASKVSVNEESHFHIETQAEVKFLISFHLENQFTATYRNSLLYHAFTKNLINEKEKERSETIWDQNGYLIDIQGGERKRLNKKIYFSVACLYHHIPTDYQEIYSERFCQFLPIRKINEYTYQLTLPDKKENRYYYNAQGICEKVEVEQTLANLTILLRQ